MLFLRYQKHDRNWNVYTMHRKKYRSHESPERSTIHSVPHAQRFCSDIIRLVRPFTGYYRLFHKCCNNKPHMNYTQPTYSFLFASAYTHTHTQLLIHPIRFFFVLSVRLLIRCRFLLPIYICESKRVDLLMLLACSCVWLLSWMNRVRKNPHIESRNKNIHAHSVHRHTAHI